VGEGSRQQLVRQMGGQGSPEGVQGWGQSGPSPDTPSSPTHPTRRFLSGIQGGSPHSSARGSRQDLFDSMSPPSSSPCHSPKPGRYLPSNLYVVLYNFQPRRQDDLGLEAGNTVQILDTSDPDWWRGRCTVTGDIGYLPHTYLSRLGPGERVHKVTQRCSLLDQDTGVLHTLRPDQVLISIGGDWAELEPGSLMVRTGETSHGLCGSVPLRYLYSV
jgi:hypothetical protein